MQAKLQFITSTKNLNTRTYSLDVCCVLTDFSPAMLEVTVWIIKAKRDGGAELPWAVPAPSIVHGRPIHPQTGRASK